MRPKALSGSIAKYSRGLALSVLTLIGASQAPGTNYYWDTNDTTAGSGAATGTWGTALWSTDSTGSTALGSVTTTNADDLFFSAGTNGTGGTVTISGTQAAHSITFDDGVAITLSGGTAINLGSATAGSGLFFTGNAANVISTDIILNSAATAIAISNSTASLQTIGAITGSAAGLQTLTVGATSTGGITLGGIIGNGGGGGTVGLTVNSSGTGVTTLSGANSYSGGTILSAGTLTGTQGSGTPFGTGALTLNGGTLSLAPTSGGNVTLTGASVASGTLFTLGGGATLALNKGAETSLTYTVGGGGTVLARANKGTLVITESTAANLGSATGERFIIAGTAPTAISTNANLVNQAMVVQHPDGTADFLKYDATNGFISTAANYTSFSGVAGATVTGALWDITAAASVTGTVTNKIGAIRVGATTLTIGTGATGKSLLLGTTATGDLAPIILNGGTIAPNTANSTTQSLTLGAGLDAPIYTSAAGGTISVNIIGAGSSLSLFGPGALTLSGGASTFTGGVTLNSGTVNINKATALGTTAGTFVINGGSIDNTSGGLVTVGAQPITINSDFTFVGSNALTWGAGATTLGTAAGTSRTITTTASTLTLGGVIANGTTANSIIKAGAGTLTLSGASTFTGGVTLTSGTLNINSAGVAATNGPLGNGGTFAINGGTIDNTSGSAKVVANVNPITLGGDFAFSTSAGTTTANDLTLPGTVDLGTATRIITTNGAGVLTFSGVVSNGGLTKAGVGTLTLSNAANTYGGVTTITGGTLSVSTLADGLSSSGIGNSSSAAANLVLDGGTLRYTGGTVTTNRAFTVTANGGGINHSPTSAGLVLTIDGTPVFSGTGNRMFTLSGTGTGLNTINGAIVDPSSGATSLTKTGSGSWTLAGNNTFSGSLFVNQGTLVLGGDNTSSSFGLFLNGGLLQVSTNANLGATSGQITVLSDSTVRSTGNVTASRQINLTAGTLTFGGAGFTFSTDQKVTGGGNISVFRIAGGNNAVTLSSASNDFTGSITIDANNSGGTNNQTLNIASLVDGVGYGNIRFGLVNVASVQQTFNYTGASDLNLANRRIEFFNSGLANGTLTSTTNAINVSTNLLVPANSSAAKTLILSAPTGVTSTFSGNIVNGTGTTVVALTKSGVGTWVLSGANTYTGATAVSAGTLIARSGSAFGTTSTANVTVATQTGMSYYAATDTALNIGGTLGITGGTTTVIGGSIGATAGVGVSSAQINVTGAATITDAAHKVNIYGNSFSGGTGTYTLIHGGAGSSLNPLTAPTLGTVFNATNFTVGTFTRTATDLQVSITAATALTGDEAYWRGTATAGLTKVWAASNGSADSNWAKTAGGSVQSLVPGSAANVFIAASPTVAATTTTLGADMTIKTLNIQDTTNGLGLNADGYTLTITPASSAVGITMDASVPASTIAANAAMGAAQTWTNNSANSLTVSGRVSGAFALTTAGTGTQILSGANTYSGVTNVNSGTLNLRNSSALGTTANTITVASGAKLQFQSGIAVPSAKTLIISQPTMSTFAATGGTSTSYSVYTVQTFTSSGTLTVTSGGAVDYLVVAGGGGGGKVNSQENHAGGGGAGGLLAGSTTVTTNQTITVGAGGAAQTTALAGGNPGGSSSLGSLVVTTGGGGGAAIFVNTKNGGSGGGGSNWNATGGTGVAGEGFNGGNWSGVGNSNAGGGGGAGGVGGTGNGVNTGGAGGAGVQSSITGTPTWYAGGGGGAGGDNSAGSSGGAGGSGVGGNGFTRLGGNINATAGLTGTGSGGGGGASTDGAAGGSGVVILRYVGAALENVSGDNTFNGAITLGSSIGISSLANTLTLGGAIGESSSGYGITKIGAGTVALSVANTYTGATSVLQGTLEVTANNALGTNAAGTSVTAGATLKLTGVNYSTAEGLIINGTGVSSGGALASSGTSTFAGLITAATSATINAISGTLELSGGLVKDGTTLTFTGAGAFTISSVISGASANSDLVVDGTTVTETVANTYNGPTTITNGGTLIANILGALPLTPRSAVSFTGSGNPTLNLGASQEVASLSSSTTSAVVNLSATGTNTLTVGAASGTTTFTGSIGGTSGNLIKDGASTQVLTGTNNTYTGTTTVSAGTLEVQGSLSGTTAVTVNTSGTLLLNSAASPIINTAATMTVGGGTVKIDNSLSNTNQTFGSLTLTGTSILDFGTGSNGNTMTFSSLSFTGTKLNVYNWSGSAYGAGVADTGSLAGDTQDRLLFNADTIYSGTSDSRIEFFSDGGTTSLGFGQEVAFGSQFELVPITAVPEPATTALIGSIALCALIGYRERRRFTGFGKRTAARK